MKKEAFIFGLVFILVFVIFLFDRVNVYEGVLDKETFPNEFEAAYFAGGCFWCTEADFEKLSGVVETISGYSGGSIENPTYKQVSSGTTKHIESVKVIYDPLNITYLELLEDFLKHIDPTDSNGQFVDRGNQYKPAIFYSNEGQRQLIDDYLNKLNSSEIFEEPITIELILFENFYEAEEYHQDYYLRNSLAYGFYRLNSGRDLFLNRIWTNENLNKLSDIFNLNEAKYMRPSDEEIKKKLTEIQYYVTQEEGTEKPFDNEYDKNYEEGIYVDIVTGEPLFSSADKYDSGTGWPSFTKPLEPENIVEKTDYKLIYPRTEIRSKIGDSHLGHLFNDGPKDKGGQRYCMNSAALRFVPKDNLKEEGYEEYVELFK